MLVTDTLGPAYKLGPTYKTGAGDTVGPTYKSGMVAHWVPPTRLV